MRTNFIKSLATAAVSISTVALLSGTAHAAGTASLTVTGGSVQQGNTITAVVRENSTDPVVSVQADLVFDTSKLECVSVDGASSAFSVQYQGACGAGTVSIARGTAGTTLTGTQTVAVVTFRAIATGSAAISFAPSSGLYRSPDAAAVWDGNTTGTAISIAAAAAPAPTAAPVAKPAATATPARTNVAVQAVTTEATPTPEATPTAAPTAAPEVAPTAAPAPSVTDDETSAVSATTIGSIIAVIAAGATALFVVRRKQNQ